MRGNTNTTNNELREINFFVDLFKFRRETMEQNIKKSCEQLRWGFENVQHIKVSEVHLALIKMKDNKYPDEDTI